MIRSRYRIIEIKNGRNPGMFVQRRYRFLFFNWWVYIVNEDYFPDNFYRFPMKFYEREKAQQHINYLEGVVDAPIKRTIL